MDFISDLGFDVKKGKAREFQEWLRANEAKLAQEAPQGWEYIGTYAAVISSEKEAGDYRQFWRHDSYAAMDVFAAAMREPTAFGQLYDEMATQFMDTDRGARWSRTTYKAVVDASLWGEE